MTLGSNNSGGAPGSDPGAPPFDPEQQREQLRAARRRADKVYGVGLLVIGLFATVVNMSIFTENALAQQFAALYQQYGLDGYQRPEGLGTLSLVGILGHPVVYAAFLYLTLVLWRRGKLAAWVPIVGAIVAVAFSAALLAIGIAMHPELAQAASTMPLPSAPSP